MQGDYLQPGMLQSDWRDDTPPYFLVDLDSWPTGLSLDPRPPLPLVGVGDVSHPLARATDLTVEDESLIGAALATIRRYPKVSATILQLLRATEGLALEPALTCESFAYAMLQASADHHGWREREPPAAPCPPGIVELAREDDILTVTLNRPAARNAIDTAMRDGLFDAFTIAALDESIRRVRLRGVGRCFSIGADLSEFGTTLDPAEAHAIRMRTLPARAHIRRPGIMDAHIQGGCVGSGLELAAFAARLTAAPDAWFQLPEASMGILAGAGGCVSLPRRIGRQRAALLMLSGRRINARKALGWGLIDAIMDEPPGDAGGTDQIS